MAEEAQRIITTIKQMEQALADVNSRHEYEAEDENLKVTYPLTRCLQYLREKHGQISRVHKERFEQVRKLVEALESYSSHLENSFVKIKLPPTSANASIPPTFDLSHSYVQALDNEFTRVYEEYTRRVATVQQLAENIIQLWAELGTPQAQTDGAIVKFYKDSPEQLGLHEDDIQRLRARRDKLNEEKKARERRLKELRSLVEQLWEKLGVEEPDRRKFLNTNRGCGVRQINEFEDELARLNELKRQNLHLFVEDARYKLQELWDGLYFSEEEMLDFTPAFSDVYSDALLEAHEQEIKRLEALKEQRAPVLALIDKHRSLIKDRDDLASASQDASRLMMRGQKGEKRDPTRLLREEKMRKRIAKELPKVSVELRKVLEQYEEEYGRPFLVHGESYLEELEAAEAKAPPPRSRTPAPGIAPQPVKKASAPPSRATSTMRPPPARAGAKTPVAHDTVRRAPPPSVSTAGGRTPSRIPARAPLSHLKHGGNSPERKAVADSRPVNGTGTVRKLAPPPARAPPPKMRDLFVPPEEPTPAYHFRNASVESDAIVRHVPPEDVYDDRAYQRYEHMERPYSAYSSHSSHASSSQHDARASVFSHAPQPAASRQISNTTITTVSGSENWETYDDVSEPEQDATEDYYARLRAARSKRVTPDGGYAPQPDHGTLKRSKGYPPPVSAHGTVIVGEDDRRIISSSEHAWTDEEAF
jgi:protein regulator of cytokinesis 1